MRSRRTRGVPGRSTGMRRARHRRALLPGGGRGGQRAAARAVVEPRRVLEQRGAARAGRGPGSRVARSEERTQLLEAAVDVVLGVEEVRADPQAVAPVVGAHVAFEQRVADLARPRGRRPRSRRRRARSGPAASAPAGPARRRAAITWSPSSPCRARIRSGVTSAITSSPPCAMKNTGAGGVPCSKPPGGRVVLEVLGVEREGLAPSRTTRSPSARARGAAPAARRGTRARVRRTAT